ncbi:hypothetical protein [Fodinicola feengrottensis]|uniref:hypothetical protein n=1 Tax=Fodinicola feengrottensis TaxID=435914 RepID=UPI0024431773|nr:hypothetical protein [Fodinicola feengrottensis]
MALVGGLAGVLATAEPAAADCQGSPCCHLARCNKCAGSCWNWGCPGGYTRQQYWGCVAGSRPIWCGECTTSTSTCWSGTFYCSIWWDDNACYDALVAAVAVLAMTAGFAQLFSP